MCYNRSIKLCEMRKSYERLVMSTAVCGAETITLGIKSQNKVNSFQMQSLMCMCGVADWDRVRNGEMRGRVDAREMTFNVDGKTVRWF